MEEIEGGEGIGERIILELDDGRKGVEIEETVLHKLDE